MFYLRQPIQMSASSTQNFRKATDAIEINVPQKNPFRFSFTGSNSSETNSNVFTEFFRSNKPRRYRITNLFGHKNIIMVARFYLSATLK